MTELDPQTIHLATGDETVLKYLGAAVAQHSAGRARRAPAPGIRDRRLAARRRLQREIEALIGWART
jgi:hypothetical protein